MFQFKPKQLACARGECGASSFLFRSKCAPKDWPAQCAMHIRRSSSALSGARPLNACANRTKPTRRHTDTQTHKHTDTHTHRDTETQRHTNTDKHRQTQTHRHTDTQTHRHTDTQTHGHTDTRTHRHTDTQTHRHTDTQTHRHTDTQTHRHTDTHTHTHRDTHTHTHTRPCHASISSSALASSCFSTPSAWHFPMQPAWHFSCPGLGRCFEHQHQRLDLGARGAARHKFQHAQSSPRGRALRLAVLKPQSARMHATTATSKAQPFLSASQRLAALSCRKRSRCFTSSSSSASRRRSTCRRVQLLRSAALHPVALRRTGQCQTRIHMHFFLLHRPAFRR